MIDIELDQKNGIALLIPSGTLTEFDFEQAAQQIEPYLQQHGTLNGVIIHTRTFPGWDSFQAMRTHFKFIQEHHHSITCIAIVTDSIIGDIAEDFISYFISSTVKEFDYDELADAKAWILRYKKLNA